MSTATLHNEKKKTLIPKLRFKGFEDEFHSTIFDKITDITRLAGYEYSQYWKEDEKEEIIALRGYNIGKGKLDLIKLAYISNELSLQLKRSRLFKGDIVYPCVGSIGNAVVIEEDNKFHIQQNIAKITCKKDVSPHFLVQFLTSDFGMNEVYRFNASGAQPNVLVGSLRKYKINIPKLPEQQKIASFLSAVDEKIKQLSRKKELLEQYKKGVMQQLFSGKLRFKDENGKDYPEWEEKKLGEIGKFYAGGDLGKLNYSKTKSNEFIYPIYANGSGEGIYGYATTFQYIKNSVTVSGRGNLGFANVRTQNFNAIVRLIVIEPKDYVNSKYLEEIINQTKFAIESTGVPQLTVPQIKSYKIIIPSYKEQQKIATFLSSVDAKIESTNQQINKMQSFKKGLLQQLFV